MPKTIRLDSFRYITNEAWRALVAIEMGMKNHEVVPIELAQKISRCKRTGTGFVKLIKDQLIPVSLVAYESDSRRRVCGYRLTNLGYDYLALHQLFSAGHLCDLGSMIGAGKESDVYLAVAGSNCGQQSIDEASSTVQSPEIEFGTAVVVKFHRLGRTSFRKVKEKREYHQHRKTCSWLYLDRLASQREFSMMKALYSHGVAVPQPLAHNRNAVVMSYVADSVQLSRVLPSIFRVSDALLAKHLYKQSKEMLQRIASLGLIHGDFNEFNLMVVGLGDLDADCITETSCHRVNLVLIDFPQMISREHPTAENIYRRDADGVVSFFSRFFDVTEDDLPQALSDIQRIAHLDVEVKAPGFPTKNSKYKGRNHEYSDFLLGATSKHQVSCSESENGELTEDSTGEIDYDKSKEDDQEAESGSEEDGESEGTPNSDEDYSEAGSKTARQVKQFTSSDTKPSNSSGLISQEEIRARHRRERRQQEQMRFQRNVKRHMRAEMKRQGRASLKAELTLFG